MGTDRDAMSEFRSAIGSLQWMAGTTRPDLAADTSLLQKGHNDLTYGALVSRLVTTKIIKATATIWPIIENSSLREPRSFVAPKKIKKLMKQHVYTKYTHFRFPRVFLQCMFDIPFWRFPKVGSGALILASWLLLYLLDLVPSNWR